LDRDAVPGTFVEVEVTDVVDDYDFVARIERVLAPVAGAPTPRRVLPLTTLPTTAGSYGR
jgi:hypothetical protein